MAFLIIGFFVLVIIVILIIANLPQFCFAGFCWSPVRDGLASKFNFYFAIILWFLAQAVVIYFWFRFIKFMVTLPSNYSKYIENFVMKFKGLFHK